EQCELLRRVVDTRCCSNSENPATRAAVVKEPVDRMGERGVSRLEITKCVFEGFPTGDQLRLSGIRDGEAVRRAARLEWHGHAIGYHADEARRAGPDTGDWSSRRRNFFNVDARR